MGEIAYHDIRSLVAEYGIELFAETGTNLGGGVKAALDRGLRKAYSIEANLRILQQADAAISAVYPRDRYELHHATSPGGVDWILSKLDAPTLWWLDAHFPRAYGDRSTPQDLPLLGEIQRIVAAGRTKDVIIADDMLVWLETSQPFPQDPVYFRGNPSDIHMARELLAPTHMTYVWTEVGGFLLALPRR